MRKITLLLAFIAFSMMTFAQMAKVPTKSSKIISKHAAVSSAKAYGDVYWKETFDGEDWSSTVVEGDKGGYLPNGSVLPGKWSLYDNTEDADAKSKWHWSDVGPRGAYSTGVDEDPFTPDQSPVDAMPEGSTVEDGFMILEADYFNTTDNGVIVSNPRDMDSYLTYGPIDLSDAPGVLMSLNTMYRFCCAGGHTFVVQVVNDYNPDEPTSGHWKDYNIKNVTKTNDPTYAEERSVEVNISETAAGHDSVYFRFHTSGLSHYYVIIDDIMLSEPPADDLNLARGWAEYMYLVESGDHFWGGYSAIPADIVSEFKRFKGAVQNNGINDASNAMLTTKIFKDGVETSEFTSTESIIGSLGFDTLEIHTAFVPADIASYQVSMTVSNGDVVDQNPANNYWGYEFSTTQNTYSHVRHGMEDNFGNASARDWVPGDGLVGGLDGDMLLVEYVIEEGATATFSGINVFIDATTDAEELAAIENGQYQMKARAFIYDTDPDVDDLVDINLTSDLYTVSISDTGSWVFIPFTDEGELLQGEGDYYVGFEQYTGTNGDLRFRIGSDDRGIKQPNGTNYVFFNATSDFGWVDANFAIDLMVNLDNVTFNVDMTNANLVDGDSVYVTGTFSDWAEPGKNGSVMMSDSDGDGIYSAVVPVPAGAGVYKYFKNTGWVNGDPTGDRNTTFAAGMVYNNRWNGPDVAVTDEQLNLVKVYPNPFSGTLTLSNLDNVTRITLSNVVGQTVMNINDIQSTVEISTSDLESGIYLISITDAYNNVRTERVVKH